MPGMIFNVVKDPNELKANKHNVSIYGDEKVDQSLLESIKQKGLLEPLVIKDDNTIISGHRRWIVLKSLGIDKVQCRIMTFNDDLDEKESLIEFNKQRVKNDKQLYNEIDALENIYFERAERTRLSNLKQNKTIERVESPTREKINKEETRTRSVIAENLNITQNHVRVLKNIGDVAKTNDTAKKVLEARTDDKISRNSANTLVNIIKKEEKHGDIAIKKAELTVSKVIERIESNPKITVERALIDVNREMKREEIKTVIPIKITNGLYNVILCDPPWRYDFAETRNREIENQYPTMTIEEMKALEIPADKDSVMFMWATAPKLKEAIGVLETWGFEYKTCAVWDKELMGMGYWLRGAHELLLIGTKGHPGVPEPENRYSSVIRSRREGHSKKPDIVYEMIEKMCPYGNYLEMFARSQREKWVVWGNQVSADSQISGVPCTSAN